jgi:hypothetical protein
MAINLKLSTASVNAMVDAHSALLNNGYLRIYDGAQPVTADTPISTQTLLAELRFANPAFAASSGGVAIANTITADSSANASGTASWYRTFESDGTTPVSDGSVGLSSCNLNLNDTAIVIGHTVAVASFTFTEPKG